MFKVTLTRFSAINCFFEAAIVQCDLFNQILIYICFICSLQMSTFKCIFLRPAMIVLFSILTIYSVMWSTTKIRYYYPFLLRFHVYRNVFIRYYSLRLNLKLHIYKFRLRPVLLKFITLKWSLYLIAWHALQL